MSPGNHHLELQKKSLRWLRGRLTGKGMRAAQEVYLGREYVADAVAVGNLQYRYDFQYWQNHHHDPLHNHAVNQRARHYEQVFVFEAKTTRADFLSTFGQRGGKHENRFNAVGTHHWVVAGVDVLTPDDFKKLSFWGVLIESRNGLKEIKPPYWCNIEQAQVLKISHTILWK